MPTSMRKLGLKVCFRDSCFDRLAGTGADICGEPGAPECSIPLSRWDPLKLSVRASKPGCLHSRPSMFPAVAK